MGLLVKGKWQDQWYDTKKSGGRFVRNESQFRNWLTVDGSPGPNGEPGFKAEPGRYHLYVSYACPWAHRTLIFRTLKGLQDMISVSSVHPLMLENGWTFDNNFPDSSGDPLYNLDFLYQLYLKAQADYSGRVTVPVLWDKQQETIVNNESAEIIRMLNSAFDELGANEGDYYPQDLADAIDETNAWVYDKINNGVYRSGFATIQEAYQEAVEELFSALEKVENILTKQDYLTGTRITEADWRLFTTLVRFDAVYVQHFKCNIKRLIDFPSISAYLNTLYQIPGISDTVKLDHIRHHYYRSHPSINPEGIIPAGPQLDFGNEA